MFPLTDNGDPKVLKD